MIGDVIGDVISDMIDDVIDDMIDDVIDDVIEDIRDNMFFQNILNNWDIKLFAIFNFKILASL